MIDPGQQIEGRLAQLASVTKNIHPRQGFEKRVMLAVSRSALGDWRHGIWNFGRYGLVLSAVTVGAQQKRMKWEAVAYGTVDFEW